MQCIFCWAIGLLHRQKLILASIKEQPFWDLVKMCLLASDEAILILKRMSYISQMPFFSNGIRPPIFHGLAQMFAHVLFHSIPPFPGCASYLLGAPSQVLGNFLVLARQMLGSCLPNTVGCWPIQCISRDPPPKVLNKQPQHVPTTSKHLSSKHHAGAKHLKRSDNQMESARWKWWCIC